MGVKWARNNESPSSSKPYQVLELLPVWEGITEDDRLAHFLSYCHGNNSCDQSALAPAGRQRPPIPLGCFSKLMLAGLTPNKNLKETVPGKQQRLASETRHVLHHSEKQKEEETQDAFFAVSASWIERSPSGLPLCDKNLARVDPPSRSLSLYLLLPPVLPVLQSPDHPPAPSMLPQACAFVNVTL